MNLFDVLKSDSKDAAYRIAGTQIIKTAKHGLLTALRNRGIQNKHIDSVANFLDTDVGSAVLSTAVGIMFNYLPHFKDNKQAATIAKEFRVNGMALAGNLLADNAIQELLPTLNNVLESLPQLPKSKIRIAELSSANEEESHHEEQKLIKQGFV